MRRHSYDSDDTEFATAVAASAHAIHSQAQNTKSNTQKQESFRPPQGGSMKKTSTTKATARSSSFLRPPVSLAEDQRLIQGFRSSSAKTDAWESARIAKIRKRYEKMHSEILAWENGKKLKEKQQMERKKSELEHRRSRNLKHYYNKIGRIDHIAAGARTQLEEKRKHEESIVKEKTGKMRATGKTPVCCFCF